ncbi:hypothetical protein QJQ45_010366 [Haematococcus lacustris]|nr:hypothetical protein QJQ45_010366 [Haematococcus lacustris]
MPHGATSNAHFPAPECTQLLDLPSSTLADILCIFPSTSPTAHAFLLSSKALATAYLQRAPLTLTYHPAAPPHHAIAPCINRVLQAREQPLELTLQLDHPLAPTPSGPPAIVTALGVLGRCPCVRSLEFLVGSEVKRSALVWTAECNAAVAACFPALAALDVDGCTITGAAVHNLLTHPQLSTTLRTLHLDCSAVRGGLKRGSQQGQHAAGPGGRRHEPSALQGSQRGRGPAPSTNPQAPPTCMLTELQLTELYCVEDLEGLVCCTPHLTSLALAVQDVNPPLTALVPALSHLPALTSLTLAPNYGRAMVDTSGLTQLLASLPKLKELLLYAYVVVGMQQLDALLAATHLQQLRLYGFEGITESRAAAACHWQRLALKQLEEPHQSDWQVQDPSRYTQWTTAAHLPLHSLRDSLHISKLGLGTMEGGVMDPGLLARAVRNLTAGCPAGLTVNQMDVALPWAQVHGEWQQWLDQQQQQGQQQGGPPAGGRAGCPTPPGSVRPSTAQKAQAGEGRGGLKLAPLLDLLRPLGKVVRGVLLLGLPEGCWTPSLARTVSSVFPAVKILTLFRSHCLSPPVPWQQLPHLLPSCTHVTLYECRWGADFCSAMEQLVNAPPPRVFAYSLVGSMGQVPKQLRLRLERLAPDTCLMAGNHRFCFDW